MPPARDLESASTFRSIRDYFKLSQTAHCLTSPSHAVVRNDTHVTSLFASATNAVDTVQRVDLPSPKRGPGRPRKSLASSAQDSQGEHEHATTKQRPEQPRRAILSSVSSIDGQHTPVKRGPGRPRKTPINPLQSSSSESRIQKRGPGRPRKPISLVSMPSSSSSQGESTMRRGSPGQPQTIPTRMTKSSPQTTGVAPAARLTSRSHPDDDPILSPTRSNMSPPDRHVAATQQSQKFAAVSFSSISTLTSVPASTQSSSKRIVKSGVKGVTNSDSGSDVSSDEGLPDIWAFMPSKRKESRSDTEDLSHTVFVRSARSNTRLTSNASKKRQDQTLLEAPPAKRYKFDLAKMAVQARKRDLVEAEIADMEMAAQAQDDHALRSDDGQPSLAITAVGSDSDERQRMVQALERTEALQETERYYFFVDDEPLFQDEPFPVESLSDEPWCQVLRETSSRTQAFLTGFVAEMAAVSPLGVNVTNWMARQLLHECREMLCAAYVEVLRASAVHAGSISDTLAMLNCFYKTRSFGEERRKHKAKSTPPPGLVNIMRMVSFCAPAADCGRDVPSMTTAAFLDLALLGIDEHMRKDINMSVTVAQCIETLLDGLSQDVFEQVITEVEATVFLPDEIPPLMQCRLILALPAGSPRAFSIRRRLALECISPGSSKGVNQNRSSEWPGSLLHNLMERKEFNISGSTNYGLFEALVSILDIAIGIGFTSYQDIYSAKSAKPQGPLGRPANTSAAELAHNQQVDTLVARLQDMASQIRGSGTTHLARTEAKSAVERVVVRLEHSVRTKPKRRKNVFDGGTSKLLHNFLQLREDDLTLESEERHVVEKALSGNGEL